MQQEATMDGHARRQDVLLTDLRDTGGPEASAYASELQDLYLARQMAALSEDVYEAARETGEPPHGWIRASDDPDLLRSLLPDADLSDEELRELLKPSG